MLGKRKKDEPSELEKKIQFCRTYTKLWADLFSFFSDKLDEATVTAQKEDEFFKIASILANRHFELTERMGSHLKEGDMILEFLCKMVSLTNLQSMSEAEFSSTQVRWHEIFIALNKTLGRLVQQMPQAPQPAAAK